MRGCCEPRGLRAAPDPGTVPMKLRLLCVALMGLSVSVAAGAQWRGAAERRRATDAKART